MSESHLTVNGSERQKVRPAVQVLSETVGKSLKYLGSIDKLKSPDWEFTSQFIILVDKWFDAMNSSCTMSDKPSRAPYRATDDQLLVLKEMTQVMDSSSVNAKKISFHQRYY
jgi:hypothetical protein